MTPPSETTLSIYVSGRGRQSDTEETDGKTDMGRDRKDGREREREKAERKKQGER
jgi:hypothetical protein